MKKVIFLFISLFLLTSLFSCSKENQDVIQAEKFLLDDGFVITLNTDDDKDYLKRSNEKINETSPKKLELIRYYIYEKKTFIEENQQIDVKIFVLFKFYDTEQAKIMFEQYANRNDVNVSVAPFSITTVDNYFLYISGTNIQLVEEIKKTIYVINGWTDVF